MNREIAEESLRATVAADRRQRPQRLLGPGLRPRRRRRRAAIARARARSWSRTTRPGSRSARWRRSTWSRPRPRPPTAARPWPRSKPRWPPRSSSLKRLLVTGTSDPLWTQELRAVDVPAARLDADRHRGRRPPCARAAHRPRGGRARTSTATTSPCATGATRRCRRSTCRSNYGAQGIGGTQFIREGTGIGSQRHRHRSRRVHRCAVAARRARLPDLERRAHLQLPDRRHRPPTPSTRGPGSCATSRRTRLRALELQVATEVTNAALQVAGQSAPRRCGPRRARAGRAAARGRAEQVRGRPVDQLLRGPGAARPGRRRERRTARAHRPAEVAGDLRARPGSAGQRASGGGQQTVGQDAGTTGTGGGH